MRGTRTGALAVALCAASLPALMNPATARTPTVQEVLAAQDRELVDELVAWHRRSFIIPDDLELDEALRQAATQMVQEHIARSRLLWPEWIAQERAASGDSNLRGRALSDALYRRAINELAILSIESAGSAHDDAWLRTIVIPTACRVLPPAHFARRVAMIQVAPVDARPALLAGERELLSRWGTKRQDLPVRPAAANFDAIDNAVAQLRAGLPVAAEPMTPYLARKVFAQRRSAGAATRWEQCAKSQWWLTSQLAGGKVDRRAALSLYRYSTMLDAREFISSVVTQKTAASPPIDGKPAYPAGAAYFLAQGSTVVEADTDAQGNVVGARVHSRNIAVPGVRENHPVAFETLFDAASLDYAQKRGYAPGKAASFRSEIVWSLPGAEDGVR